MCFECDELRVPAEGSTDGAGSSPGRGHAVHSGDGLKLSAGSQRLLQTVLSQSQSKEAALI